MTVSHDPYIAEQTSAGTSSGDVKDVAKDQAQQVGTTAKDQAAQVVDTAKEQAQAVTSEVKGQAQQLASDAQNQLMEHATVQRDQAVDHLRAIGRELSTMADNAEGSGLGVQIVRQGGDLTDQAAKFLEAREPGDLLDELRGLARRRPGAFLLGAAFAGLLVGRAARGVKSAHSSDGNTDAAATATTPAVPVVNDVPVTTSDAWGRGSTDYPAVPSAAAPGVSPLRGDVP